MRVVRSRSVVAAVACFVVVGVGSASAATIAVFDNAAYVDTGVKIGADTWIGAGAGLYAGTRIGRDCEIGAGCQITDSRIGNGVQIAPFTVLLGARIKAGEIIG